MAASALFPDPDALAGQHIVLGVTGGVAAYKACELVRALQQHGATVQVVMSEAGTRFVTPATFQALSGRPVFVDAWDTRPTRGMAHIDLGREASVLLVAPASADFMAKVAHGQADDLLSTLVLARDVPLMLAPAMNRQMWQAAPTQRNLQTLLADGVIVVGPDDGAQACGETGPGRMLEPDALVEAVIAQCSAPRLRGRRVVVTAGPTIEPIDPVRGLTNASSGKMGYVLARACRHAGAAVTLISGPTALPCPHGVTRQDVRTAREMLAAVESAVSGCDLFMAVAAVADWRVAHPAAHKLKKQPDTAPPSLELVANPDILATIAARPDAPFCVGFAAETDTVVAHAQAKRARKNVPVLIGNHGPSSFGAETCTLWLIDAHSVQELPHASKATQARRLVTELADRLDAARPLPAPSH